jgi:hypothetical protein
VGALKNSVQTGNYGCGGALFFGILLSATAFGADPGPDGWTHSFETHGLGPVSVASEPEFLAVPEDASSSPEAILAFPETRFWNVVPRLETGVLYDSNIYLQAQGAVGDWITSFSPGVSLELGAVSRGRRFFAQSAEGGTEGGALWMDAALTWLEFQQNRTQSAGNGVIQLGTVWGTERTGLGLEWNWESVTERAADIGGRISVTGQRLRRETASAVLRAVYELTEKSVIETDLLALHETRERTYEMEETRFLVGLSYAATAKIRASLQGSVGRVQLVDGLDQSSVRGVLVLKYEPTAKTTVQLQAGLEQRRIGGGTGSFLNPLVSLDVEWAATERLRLRASLERMSATSRIFPTENFVRSTAQLGVEWDLFGDWKCRGFCGAGKADYTDAVRGTREEEFVFARLSVARQLGCGWEVECGFEHRENRSSQLGAGYQDSMGFLQFRLSR